MAEANLQGMIYYIQKFKSICRSCTHAYVDLVKFRTMYHQQDMGEAHKDPEVVPTVYPNYWPKTLETVEDCIRGFWWVDGKPLSYGLGDDSIYFQLMLLIPRTALMSANTSHMMRRWLLKNQFSVGLRCLELSLKMSNHSSTRSLQELLQSQMGQFT